MVSKKISLNKEELKEIFNNTSDLILYEFNTLCNCKALVAYIESLIDRNGLYNDLLKPLIHELKSPEDILTTVPIAGAVVVSDMKAIVKEMLMGKAALFIEDKNEAYIFELGKWQKRQIEEPGNERVIKGPKEGFVEDISVNKGLIRRRIKNPNLVFEDYTFGSKTNTSVSLVYLADVVNPAILNELRQRLKNINVESILDASYIEQLIKDSSKSIIPTVGHTEKPDVAVGKILEGRIAIICDASPIVLTVPKIFIENLQTSEDYYTMPKYATYLRLLRVFSLIIAITLPGILVALKSFHQEMLPTSLLMSMASSREDVPFSALIEALLMLIFLEIIKESSIRTPTAVGQAVTVVSGLVLGQTAVQAGLVGPVMVIAIGVSGITEFILSSLKEMIVLYRFIILLLGGTLGLFGVVCGIIMIIVHLISIKSFGIPYMYPVAPYDKDSMKDFIIRYQIDEKDDSWRISEKKGRKRNDKEK
ncbi:MAG TPA: spore germination protein [Tissierellaceae bacterium]